LGTEVSTIGEEIIVEEELVSSGIATNQREIPETTCSSQKKQSDYNLIQLPEWGKDRSVSQEHKKEHIRSYTSPESTVDVS